MYPMHMFKFNYAKNNSMYKDHVHKIINVKFSKKNHVYPGQEKSAFKNVPYSIVCLLLKEEERP